MKVPIEARPQGPVPQGTGPSFHEVIDLFYYWKTGDNGDLWLSGEGIREAYSRKYPGDPVCSEVSLLGEKDLLNVSFVLDKSLTAPEKLEAERRFQEFAEKLGFLEIQSSWIKEDTYEGPITSRELLRSPVFWGGAAWIATAVLKLGLTGTLLATAAAVAAFSVSALYTTERGNEIRRWFRRTIERKF